jgi:hypothetical protein
MQGAVYDRSCPMAVELKNSSAPMAQVLAGEFDTLNLWNGVTGSREDSMG